MSANASGRRWWPWSETRRMRRANRDAADDVTGGDLAAVDGLAARLRRDGDRLGSPDPSLRRRVLASVREASVEPSAPALARPRRARLVAAAAVVAAAVVALSAWAILTELTEDRPSADRGAAGLAVVEAPSSVATEATGDVRPARESLAGSAREPPPGVATEGPAARPAHQPLARPVDDPLDRPASDGPSTAPVAGGSSPLAGGPAVDAPLASSDPPLMGTVDLGRLPSLTAVEASVLYATVERPLLVEASRIGQDAAATAGFVVDQLVRALARLTPSFHQRSGEL